MRKDFFADAGFAFLPDLFFLSGARLNYIPHKFQFLPRIFCFIAITGANGAAHRPHKMGEVRPELMVLHSAQMLVLHAFHLH